MCFSLLLSAISWTVDFIGVRYHFNWLVDLGELAPGVMTKPDPALDNTVGIMLSAWDIGYSAILVDINAISPEVNMSIHSQAECHPNRPKTKSAKRAAARKRSKQAKQIAQSSNLEDGLD